MPILGNQTVVATRVSRARSNALRIELTAADGTELARAQQKGGVGVLLGFKNGGKSEYTLSGAAGDELRLAVAGTTSVTAPSGELSRRTARPGWKTAAAASWRSSGHTPGPRHTAPGITRSCPPKATNWASSP
ncbi:MAG TPA: hypothetical protein VMU34_24975 [Mycobacterium sp.]|nr:hypothetical protein [Mycobacterium sp.]